MRKAADGLMQEKVPFWLDPKKRAILFQILTVCTVGLIAWYLVSNTLYNLQKQSIATGFSFLKKEASFEIGESIIPYSAASRYALFYETMPPPREAICPGAGIYLCNRGAAFTIPEAHLAHLYMLLAFLL